MTEEKLKNEEVIGETTENLTNGNTNVETNAETAVETSVELNTETAEETSDENTGKLILDTKAIMEILPHRFPFLLVDRIVEGAVGEYAVGIKNVTINEWFFQGHFPGEPILPGVLIIEALAQVGAVAMLSREEYRGGIALFAGINKARFNEIVRPGDTLRLETRLLRMRGAIGIAEGRATVNGKQVCSAELWFGFKSPED